MGKIRTRGVVLEKAGASRPFAVSRPLTVSDIQLEYPGPGEVLVRIEAAGICHSDLSVVDGNRVRPTPMLLGHEAAGIVEEVGEGTATVRRGSRVVMTFLPRCGECSACETEGQLPCVPGSVANSSGELMRGGSRITRHDGELVKHHLGVSGFAQHAVVDARSVVPVDADVPPEIAAILGCAVLTGGGAVLNVGRPRKGDSTAVVGLGGVGMAALLVAVAQGRGPVFAIDSNPNKLSDAIDAGACEAYTPDEAITAGLSSPVVIECAGHPRAFETAFNLTAPGGRTVTVGLPPPGQMSQISPLEITSEARTVSGSYMGSAVPERDIPKLVEMWRSGRLPLERLTTSFIDLDDINEGMDNLAEGSVLRQIIVFSEGTKATEGLG